MRVLLGALLVLAAAHSPSWAGDSEPEKKSEEKADKEENADAKRRAALRLQRNDRILSQKELEAAMAPHVPAIQGCYKSHAANQKSAKGTLQLEMLIRPEGKVQKLWVRAEGVKGPKLEECIQELSNAWVFPKKPGFTNAIVPFYFQKTNARGTGPLESCWSAKGCPDKRRPKKAK
jgi:hypothetical protein